MERGRRARDALTLLNDKVPFLVRKKIKTIKAAAPPTAWPTQYDIHEDGFQIAHEQELSFSLLWARPVSWWFIAKLTGLRFGAEAAQCDSSGTECVKHGQLFLDGHGCEALAELALALHDFAQVKSHPLPPRNCCSNRRHATSSPWRTTTSSKRAVSSAPASTNWSIFDVHNPRG
jgi:hypothetical protein